MIGQSDVPVKSTLSDWSNIVHCSPPTLPNSLLLSSAIGCQMAIEVMMIPAIDLGI